MSPVSTIGQPVPRIEGPEKVTGRTRYTADTPVEGTLWGAAARSPLPHARIVSIDTSRARALPGVHAVLTGADIGERRFGRSIADVPALATDRVLFVGDPVAAVAAKDRDTAREAVRLIDVQYEELPAVFDPFEAMQRDAPILHPNFATYKRGVKWGSSFEAGAEAKASPVPNLVSYESRGKGDVDQGFREADLVFEHRYQTQIQHQGYIEPHTCLVSAETDGGARIWASNKSPFTVRDFLARDLEVLPEKLVFEPMFVGGDFGGKGSPMQMPLAYFLSRAAGRPVLMLMDGVEEMSAANPRHRAWITIRSGIKRDGTFVARHVKMVLSSGAYGGYKPIPDGRIYGTELAGGIYRIPHFQVECQIVYTNHVPAGHMRSPGGAQVYFASEVDVDRLAEAVGLDPLEFRLRNAVEEGDLSPLAEHWTGVRAKECLVAVRDASGWGQPKQPNVGRGLAACQDVAGAGGSTTRIDVQADGTAAILTSVNDQGSGAHTIICQLVAHELQIPLDRVRLQQVGTAPGIWDRGSSAMSVTHVAGQATVIAAREVREKLAAVAAEFLGCAEDQVELVDGVFRDRERPEVSLPFAEVAARACRGGDTVTVTHRYENWTLPTGTGFAAQVAEVEVDRETGQVTVRQVTGVTDVGTVLNPIGATGQIEGAMVMGLGFATMEDLSLEAGRVQTAGLHEYKLPTIRDVPRFENRLITGAAGPGPFGAKGVAELAHIPMPAAIANAVYDAVGVRITDLPVTAEKVKKALQEQAG